MAKTEKQTDRKQLFDDAAVAEMLSKWKLAWHSGDLRAQGIGFIDIALYIIYVLYAYRCVILSFVYSMFCRLLGYFYFYFDFLYSTFFFFFILLQVFSKQLRRFLFVVFFLFLAVLRVFQRCDKSFHLIAIFRLPFRQKIFDIFFAEQSQMVFISKINCVSNRNEKRTNATSSEQCLFVQDIYIHVLASYVIGHKLARATCNIQAKALHEK